MPKETVQYPRTDGSVGTEVSVHWTKQAAEDTPCGWVQVSITRHPWEQPACPNGCDGVLTGCSECPPKGRLALGGQIPMLPPGPETDEAGTIVSTPLTSADVGGSETMYADPMTRDELNRLIRTLRRARDQAYGRDE